MTDKKRIEKFAKFFGFNVIYYKEPRFIQEESQKAGAVESLNLTYGTHALGKDISKAYVDLNFEIDADGKCVAFSTSHQGSFHKRD